MITWFLPAVFVRLFFGVPLQKPGRVKPAVHNRPYKAWTPCRLCLSSCRGSSQDYLKNPDLASKIRTHLSVELENTSLPTIICNNCIKKLNEFNIFYKKVEKNQLQIQNKHEKYEDGTDPERSALKIDCQELGLDFAIASVIYDNLKRIRSNRNVKTINDTEPQIYVVKEENSSVTGANFITEENNFVAGDDNFGTENDNSVKEEDCLIENDNFIKEDHSFVTKPDNPSKEKDDFVTANVNFLENEDDFVAENDKDKEENDDVIKKDPEQDESGTDTKDIDSGDEYQPQVYYKHQTEYTRTRELPERKVKKICKNRQVIKIIKPPQLEEQHKCLTCLEFKGPKWVLLKHYKTAHGPAKEEAQEKYNTETSDSGKDTYKCNQCDAVLPSVIKILTHLEGHEQNRPYACKICGRAFNTAQDIFRHGRSHDDGPKYFCRLQCGYSTHHTNNLKLHEKQHNKVYKYKCSECGKGYESRTDYEEHQRWHQIIHSGLKPFKCNQCNKAFTRRAYLQAHIFKMHSNQKRFVCMHCSHPCLDKAALKKHLKNKHGMSSSALCELCGKRLVSDRSDQLTLHMRVCRGIHPYSCSYCPKTFSKKYGLTLHLRTHTGERKYSCNKCGRSYTQLGILRRHPCKPQSQRNQAASKGSLAQRSAQDKEQ